jgi:shikimate dehydrogenase
MSVVPGGRVRQFGLIGDPVGHSLSPAMHQAAFRELGVEAYYELVRVPAETPDAVEPAMHVLAAGGGGNVTLPHKLRAAQIVEASTRVLQVTGACNCFWLDEAGRLAGDNTDVGGIRAVLGSLDGFDPVDSRVLIVGAGGAGTAAAAAALEAGASRVHVLNRSEQRLRRLISSLGDPRLSGGNAESGDDAWDLVIQATSLGLADGDPLPVSLGEMPPGHALDLVYRPGGTAWCEHARACGWEAEDGLRVLLEQGILSLEHWFGFPIGSAVRSAMEKALCRAATR